VTNRELEPAKDLPRWVQVPAGILLFLFAALALVGSISMIIAPPPVNPPLAVLVGTVLVVGCLWVLVASVRLMAGRPRRTGGLLSPLALRVTGVLFGAAAPVALFAGVFLDRGHGWLRALQALLHFSAAVTLFRLAALRTSARQMEERGESPPDA
jgi:hypothetical protein